ncbi:M56 family metallopeptidase [Streptomyces sp. NPDC059349]|uniref:M56 family metallopeptidase n=1 Tax=Streptomyces sp. NPDC059349 TaxID=3346808 RepID=UPI0036A57928
MLALCRLMYQRRELREARAASGPTAGDLFVAAHEHPYAYALPGRFGRGGTIVASSGMLQALSVQECDALLAHERAHLRGRHHMFLSLAQLASALHPALRILRQPLAFHLERWADESAAAAVGDRTVIARAITRAALAAHDLAPRQPSLVLGATSGPVPQRVLALLSPAPGPKQGVPQRAWRMVAGALLCCLTLSAAGALHAVADLHTEVEAAQGQGTAGH